MDLNEQAKGAVKFFQDRLTFTLGPVELKEKLKNNEILLVDVRKAEDFQTGHIPSAISLPKKELENNLDKLSKDKITVVYCYTQQCHLAARAALFLAENGYPVMELEGGIQTWRDSYKFEIQS